MPQFTPTVLTTKRLTLRWLTEADAPAQFAIFSDPKVVRYWSIGAWTELAQSEKYIEQVREAYRTGSALRFGIVLTETGELIGSVNLYAFFEANRRCEVGYALASSHWRRGYLTEALSAVLDYGFREFALHRVEADIDPRNEASARLLERLAFQKEGYMRERWFVGGEVCDTEYYGLLRRDWEAR
jgi:ribosomal-protein-alanine N-acetyltransferase